ncbi:uncharacterized protein [Pagrus major]|uniref:uncharacterized protein isoform X2 n=1 Tax=Pagrus major TaxID=143350 RepID=UPI003CC871E1
MSLCSTASPAGTNGGSAMCGQMSKKVSPSNYVSLRAQSRDSKNRQGSGCVTTPSQGPKDRPLSTVCTSNGTPRSHQRRWSADFCKCGASPVITVRKNKKEPQPPQRGVSLSQPNTASHPSSKRYSCPPLGVLSSPSHLSSSSSSSSTSSCSSPPPVQTSVITGPDPLGWKLHPKSNSTSPQARTNRLSLQIPLPVISPQPKSSSAPPSQSDSTPNPEPSPRTKPLPRPKPSRRHSDSSAFLRSRANPLPAVTLEELRGVHLRSVTLLDESDDVFGEEKEVKVTTRPRKIPPPVPEKTAMARQVAQLIAHSHQRCKSNEENIYTSVIKPKPRKSHQTEDHSSLQERKTGLRVDASCDRERSTPRFPG